MEIAVLIGINQVVRHVVDAAGEDVVVATVAAEPVQHKNLMRHLVSLVAIGDVVAAAVLRQQCDAVLIRQNVREEYVGVVVDVA